MYELNKFDPEPKKSIEKPYDIYDHAELYKYNLLEKDSTQGFIQEVYHDPVNTNTGNIIVYPFMVDIFETDKPAANQFILFYGKNWKKNTKKTPVLLVEGAGASSTFWNLWKKPSIPENDLLINSLIDNNYKVFSITSGSLQGSNQFKAEHIAMAIDVIKDKTGSDKVDVISTGMGHIKFSVYASSFIRYKWRTKYKNDVRKYIGIGSPNYGIDYHFRHPFMSCFSDLYNSFFSLLYFTGNTNPLIFSYNPFFMDHNMFGFNIYEEETTLPDLSPCPNTLEVSKDIIGKFGFFLPESLFAYNYYYGGWTEYGYSLGIHAAERIGGYTIENINKNGFSKDMEIYMGIGLNPIIPFPFKQSEDVSNSGLLSTRFDYKIQVINKSLSKYNKLNDLYINGACEPIYSDGVITIPSLEYDEGLMKNGSKLTKKYFLEDHFYYQHNPEINEWVHQILAE